MGTSGLAYRAICLMGVMALCLVAGVARADPSPGFGLYVGPVYSSDTSVYGSGHGLAFGADAQFVYNEAWTLSPYLSFTDETSDSSVHVVELTGGLQARRWFGQWFLGGQYLFHSTFLTRSGQTLSGAIGPSLGLVGGWESDNHWSVVVQADALEGAGFSWFNGNGNRHDVRVLIGYHWY